MFCHRVELIQDAALNVFVVGEVWKVLCQHDEAYAHFGRDALGYHKRTFLRPLKLVVLTVPSALRVLQA
jgi:hypothetical protein